MDLFYIVVINEKNPISHQASNRGMCALPDLGNTSFISCVLQLFLHTHSIRKIATKYYDFLEQNEESYENGTKGLSERLVSIIQNDL